MGSVKIILSRYIFLKKKTFVFSLIFSFLETVEVWRESLGPEEDDQRPLEHAGVIQRLCLHEQRLHTRKTAQYSKPKICIT